MKEKQIKNNNFLPTYPTKKIQGIGTTNKQFLRMASVQGKLQNKNEK